MKPIVSVIIPLFNQSRFIADAINSILEQTYDNIEIIVINDGSTDHPEKVLNNYSDSIKIINKENQGLSSARNTGIIEAKGEYIQFLDSDDVIYKSKIEIQLNAMIKNKMDISYCEIIQGNGKTHKNIGKISNLFDSYYNFWEKYPTPIHSLLIRKNIFNKYGLFNEHMKANEDRLYFSKLALSGTQFMYIPIVGGIRRFHDNNMSKDKKLMIENTILYYRKINKIAGNQAIRNRYGFTGYDMMCANITHLWISYISQESNLILLLNIWKIIRSNNIILNPFPVPYLQNKKALIRKFAGIIIYRIYRFIGIKL